MHVSCVDLQEIFEAMREASFVNQRHLGKRKPQSYKQANGCGREKNSHKRKITQTCEQESPSI
jgi:hypothetical protein